MQENHETPKNPKTKLVTQSYNHEVHGLIDFQDKKQNVHSQKVSPKDLTLMTSTVSRSITAEIKRDICAEINNQKEPDAESGIGRNKQ